MKLMLYLLFAGSLITSSAIAATYEVTIDWAQRIAFAAPVHGRVTEVLHEAGDFIEAQTAIVRVDDTPYRHRVTISDSMVARTAAQHRSATDALAREQELFEIGSLSTVELDRVKLTAAVAESAYNEAVAQRELARYELDQTTIKTAFDGWLVEQHTAVGQYLNPAASDITLFVLAPAQRYLGVADVPMDVAHRISLGASIAIAVGDRNYLGRVVTPRANSTEPDRYLLHLRFDTDGGSLLPGTTGLIDIP